MRPIEGASNGAAKKHKTTRRQLCRQHEARITLNLSASFAQEPTGEQQSRLTVYTVTGATDALQLAALFDA